MVSKTIFLTVLLLCQLTPIFAQNNFPANAFIVTDIPNSFVKGDDSVIHFIKKKNNVCKHSTDDETVVLRFIIEPDGSQSNLDFITDTNEFIKNDVLKMFNDFPKWKVGIQSGVPVRSLRMLLFKCENAQVVLPPYETPKFKN